MSERLAVCRLEATSDFPVWATRGGFYSATRTENELSVVCVEAGVPSGVQAERGWRALQLEGPMPFTLTGVLASVAVPLADAKIGMFAISTFDTDYVLVKATDAERAAAALAAAGHEVLGSI
jgi:hypothetical protein